MVRCPSCSAEMERPSRFCPSCGADVSRQKSSSEAATLVMAQRPAPVSSSFLDEGRFPAGTLLADRYRVIGLLGRGGMGEVYRANDLKLGQPVALKFLPEATAGNQRWLERFRDEVRIARQVSHPNVCRVYDIGEIEGLTFLSMEYVDGEDLGSLLRRIGRLPGDKALEMARKLCAGLAAAHDKGVLHRDLKPANIMIDGRGNILIMDFGLAGMAGRIEDGAIREGTPAYMAPEQLAGKEVSVRSDIYALGLVLYEMFTGKQFTGPVRRTAHASVSNASTAVKDLDPAVERVILRCLDEDPLRRPQSVLAVAAALPGGDPLAAALAAGETPSPEMVAAAGQKDGIAVRTAVVCLALVLAGLAAAAVWGARTSILQRTAFENSTDALAQKAREILASVGYTAKPIDRAYGFYYDEAFQDYAQKKEKPEDYEAQLDKGQPPIIGFWYRQSPQYLEDTIGPGAVTDSYPAPVQSGMIGLNLDAQGRLLSLNAVPPQFEEKPAPEVQPDWKPLFAAAGLEMARFTSAQPQWLALAGFDARAAWTGSLAHTPNIATRIEAAAWHGKPVYFLVAGPWTRPDRMQPDVLPSRITITIWGLVTLLFAMEAAAGFLAWKNYRLERGDLRGASRLAIFVVCAAMLGWALEVHHTPTFQEVNRFFHSVGAALLAAGMFWILYVALEPAARRRWPQSLITWTRLLAGSFRDPLVGGQVLIGVVLGMAFTVLYFAGSRFSQRHGRLVELHALLDARHLTAQFLQMMVQPILLALGTYFLFFLFRALFRREWLAAAAFVALFSAPSAFGSAALVNTTVAAVHCALMIVILVRFGLLPLTVGMFVYNLLSNFPMTTDFSTWYASSTIFALAAVLALTAYAFHTALAGRRLFKEGLLED